MKQSKIYGILVMLLLVGFGLTACSSGDDSDADTSGDSRLIGTWVDVQYRYTCAWRFEKNGTCQYTEWENDEPEYWDSTDHVGKWKVNGDILNVHWGYGDGDYDDYNFTFTISDDGKTLTLYDGDYGKRGTYTKR